MFSDVYSLHLPSSPHCVRRFDVFLRSALARKSSSLTAGGDDPGMVARHLLIVGKHARKTLRAFGVAVRGDWEC